MSRNGHENAIEAKAAKKLLLQARNFYPSLNEIDPHDFYQLLRRGGNSKIRHHIITRGPDKGKLTLEHNGWEVDKRIEPVDVGNIGDVVEVGAIELLLRQAQEVYNNGFHKYEPENFYTELIAGNVPETKPHFEDGKLSLKREWVIDGRITPVDCYNLMNKGEDIAGAVNRLLAEGYLI